MIPTQRVNALLVGSVKIFRTKPASDGAEGWDVFMGFPVDDFDEFINLIINKS
jgi:hypothetical protein